MGPLQSREERVDWKLTNQMRFSTDAEKGGGLGMIQVYYICCALYFYYYYVVIYNNYKTHHNAGSVGAPSLFSATR